MRRTFLLSLATSLVFCVFGQERAGAWIEVDLDQEIGEMTPLYAWFGYDEPNYTYMKDGQKLLTEIAELSPVPVFVRTHSLLVSGDGQAALKWGSTNAYTEDANGNPVYDWTIVDRIFDTYVERGMKPLVQIGFMPEALSSKPDPYRHHWKPGDPYNDIYTGWSYPPADYEKWSELVFQWVAHCIDRYGREEAESWYWELWNEPDINYWQGTTEEYLKLYDYTADAVKRALPTALFGGPNATGGAQEFMKAFLDHCLYGTNYLTGEKGSPLDVVLFHAKGSPSEQDGQLTMNLGRQLSNIRDHLELILSYPELKDIPLIIGESDPEGCAACAMAYYPQYAYRNGTVYPSYTAAAFARKYALARQYDAHLIGAVTWAFEFENQPWFAGFRDLATNGVDKPVLNVFRMFGKMGGKRIQVESDRMYPLDRVLAESVRGEQTDIGALASKDEHSAAVMVWNYHDVDRVGEPERVSLRLDNVPAGEVTLTHFRVDREHSNAYEAWKAMGSPQDPSPDQYAALEKAGQLDLLEEPEQVTIANGALDLEFSLPRQGVSLILLEW